MSDLTRGEREHFVGPFDQLTVDVLGLPELSRNVRVDASGDIGLPLAGTINVIGKNPEEIARDIERHLRANYVKDPRVTVGIGETVSQTVTVDGEVNKPGAYPIEGPMTMMRAIARAQGTSDTADAKHVVLFRTVKGQQMAALYDLRAIRLGAYEDPPVYTNDLIVVGESNARRLFPQILQAGGLLLTPVITVLNNL